MNFHIPCHAGPPFQRVAMPMSSPTHLAPVPSSLFWGSSSSTSQNSSTSSPSSWSLSTRVALWFTSSSCLAAACSASS
jgi:hypothetical protein